MYCLHVAFCSVMLRLPTVSRALAGAAKSSLAPSNTGKTCMCVLYIFYVCVHVCQGRGCLQSRINKMAQYGTLFFFYTYNQTRTNITKSDLFMSTFSAYFRACSQQHGGSVCRWETSGGGAWNYRAAGTQQQIILFQSSVHHCSGSEKDTCICWIFTRFSLSP